MTVAPMSFMTSESFAVLLGLEAESKIGGTFRTAPLHFAQGKELERHGRLKFYIKSFLPPTEKERDVIWSRFCARYLPAAVDRFLDLPIPTDAIGPAERGLILDFPANNAWLEILVQIQHIPYFYKYLRSSSEIAAPGQRLSQVLASRLADLSGRWESKMTTDPDMELREYYVAIAGCAVQLLGTLCTYLIKVPDRNMVITQETQVRMAPILRTWALRYRNQLLGNVCIRLLAWFSGTKEFERASNMVRKNSKNWDVCGLPLCSIRTDLKICKRCHTVRYCCVEHQRADWSTSGSKHKLYCFETEY
ncbi:hypothetical protein GGX14DRAFT_521734 [Mycena pura]|uniref:MYND-type domain-containing protein n=1 Tax=Mycena pura TaxID=153505 RepID=A0AAD6VD43_9AGAR|nr:hypothetical protein GGX14DRAFT_521734 [Mycena pura]